LIRYILYLVRWQLSTPVLACCWLYFDRLGTLWATVLANLIGGLLFFWVDRFIFSGRINEPLWSVKEDITCADCGIKARGYRLILARNYDRRKDQKPEFRCEKCSSVKATHLRDAGIAL
jgi:hypothetical protein